MSSKYFLIDYVKRINNSKYFPKKSQDARISAKLPLHFKCLAYTSLANVCARLFYSNVLIILVCLGFYLGSTTIEKLSITIIIIIRGLHKALIINMPMHPKRAHYMIMRT